MRIFGIKSILRMIIWGSCIILWLYFLDREKFVRNPVVIVGPISGAMVFLILQTTIITTKDNLLKTYNVWTFIRQSPKWLFISEIKKMHIMAMGSKLGGTFIHLMSRNEEVITINTQFGKADIRSFERFMIERGVEVQNPEK